MNTSVFAVSLIPMLVRFLMQHGIEGLRREAMVVWNEQRYGKDLKTAEDEEDTVAGERLLVDDEPSLEMEGFETTTRVERLTFRETAVISLEFCMLWFFANYFASACLEYTSVGSVTILNSTSSVWTLVFCAVMGVEGFTARKLIGVLASLTGIVLISTVDLSGSSDENRGSFPHKTTGQIAIGDLMAFVSAIIYGLYVTVMKRRVGNEDRVNMPLFFGLVGLFNLVFLWPVFFILHFTGMEPVSHRMPPKSSWAFECLIKVVTVLIPSYGQNLGYCHWQLAVVLHQRHVVGIRHAAHDAASCDGRFVPHDPAVAHWRDDPVLAVLQLGVLGRRGCGAHLVSIHQ